MEVIVTKSTWLIITLRSALHLPSVTKTLYQCWEQSIHVKIPIPREKWTQQPSPEPQAPEAAPESPAVPWEHTPGCVPCSLELDPGNVPAEEAVRELPSTAGASLGCSWKLLAGKCNHSEQTKDQSRFWQHQQRGEDCKAVIQGWGEAKCWNVVFHLQVGICSYQQ